MGNKYEESELSARKVPELKELAILEGIDVESSWRKADIINALLEIQDESIEEIEDISEDFVEEEPEANEVENKIEDVTETLADPEPVVEVEKHEARLVPLVLERPVIMYKDKEATQFLDKVYGYGKILSDEGSVLKIEIIKSGRGILNGYIKK